jgi:hypothetical protein
MDFGWAMNTCVCHHTSVALSNMVLICSCQVPGSKEIKTTSSDMGMLPRIFAHLVLLVFLLMCICC